MKTALHYSSALVLALLLFLGEQSAGQSLKNIPISSEIKEVTVFTTGAEIIRLAKVDLPKGRSELEFKGLTPYLIGNSVRVKTNQPFTLLSINSEVKTFKKDTLSSSEIEKLVRERKGLTDQIQELNIEMEILNKEKELLNENSRLKGEQQNLTTTEVETFLDFAGSKLRELASKKLNLQRRIEDLNKKSNALLEQINYKSQGKTEKEGIVKLLVEAEKANYLELTLEYVVKGAGWFPSYDVRMEKLDQPLQVAYKAKVFQNTGIDWKGIQLNISSSNPNDNSGQIPELTPWFIRFGQQHQQDYLLQKLRLNDDNLISGIVIAEDGNPLPGATIMLKGTSVGTVTNIDGYYELRRPTNAKTLTVSFVGYETHEISVATGNYSYIRLEPSYNHLDEVVTTAYGVKRKSRKENQVSEDIAMAGSTTEIKIRGMSSIANPQTTAIAKATNVFYEINTPYSIPSNGKAYWVTLAEKEIPSGYSYITVPKLEEKAYLVASIPSWSDYDLLEGEANLFLEGTFVGSTIIGEESYSDTLTLSLGQDEAVLVKREKDKDFSKKRFLGSKKEESRAFTITVVNNKSADIFIEVIDQIPVPTSSEIEIDHSAPGANVNGINGIVRWKEKLPSKKDKKLKLNYSAKYPKDQTLFLD